MKILFVTHYSSLYGANRSLLNLIDGLKEFNVESFVLCPSDGEIVKELRERKIPFSVFPFRNWMNYSTKFNIKAPLRMAINLILLPLIIMQIRRWNIDVVYTNSSVTPIGALIAIIMKKPHIWHIREFGELDYQLHHDFGKNFFKKLVNKANTVIAISNAVKRVVLDGISTKIYVIYNGVVSEGECDALKEKALLFNKSSNYTFTILGFLTPNKGQEQAIRALAHIKERYPNIRLLIVGSGNYLKFLQKLCYELDVNTQVEFLGYISNPFDAYLKADAVLMCSKYEAMGRTTAEAMATARPVIGYNNGGTAEIIENGVTGILYYGGYESLAEAMVKFIENPKWARELGINGWKKARREYTIEIYARRIYDVLKEVVNHA